MSINSGKAREGIRRLIESLFVKERTGSRQPKIGSVREEKNRRRRKQNLPSLVQPLLTVEEEGKIEVNEEKQGGNPTPSSGVEENQLDPRLEHLHRKVAWGPSPGTCRPTNSLSEALPSVALRLLTLATSDSTVTQHSNRQRAFLIHDLMTTTVRRQRVVLRLKHLVLPRPHAQA